MASLAVTTAHEFMYLHSPTLLGSGHPAEEEEEEESLLVDAVPYPLTGPHASLPPKDVAPWPFGSSDWHGSTVASLLVVD